MLSLSTSIMKQQEPYHHGDLRNSLIQYGLLLLEDQGIDNFSLRDVAKSAGVSHNAPYRHFKNKTALLAGLAEVGFLRLYVAVQQAVAQAGNKTTEQLIAAGYAYVKQATHSPEMFRLMFAGLLDHQQGPTSLKNAADRAYESLQSIIQQGVKDHSFREVDVCILTTTAWSSMHGLAMLFIAGHFTPLSEEERDAMIFEVAKTVVYGVKQPV